MKKLNHWLHCHPYKAVLFTMLFTLVASCAAVVSEHGFRYLVALYIILLMFWVVFIVRDMRRLPVILALAMGVQTLQAAETPPQASPVGIGVGVVVICVGGYCVYRVVKFCQRKFPKETGSTTNSPPSFIPSWDGESAASWNYGSMGSCDPTLTPGGPDLLAQEASATLFTVDVRIDDEGKVAVRTSAIGEAATQSWAEFQAEVARHGIQVTGSADASQYFSTNRVPCNPSDVPIAFDIDTKTVDLRDSGGPVKLIEVERSRDFINWSPFLRTRLGAGGRGIRIEDATVAASMFYRVTVSSL